MHTVMYRRVGFQIEPRDPIKTRSRVGSDDSPAGPVGVWRRNGRGAAHPFIKIKFLQFSRNGVITARMIYVLFFCVFAFLAWLES
jgi:hypothetical protein